MAKKISINQIDKIIASQAPKENKITLSYTIEDEVIDVIVTPLLSMENMFGLVEAVSQAICDDNSYNPTFREVTFNKALLAFYTNLKFEMNNDKFLSLMYETDLFTRITELLNQKQLCDIKIAIENQIEFSKQQLISEQKKAMAETNARINQEQNKVVSDMNNLIDVIGKMVSEFKDIDSKKLTGNLDKIASIPDKERVNNILEFHNKISKE